MNNVLQLRQDKIDEIRLTGSMQSLNSGGEGKEAKTIIPT